MYQKMITFLTFCAILLIPSQSSAQESLKAGDLIKGSAPAVYYYHTNGKRYVFPTEKIFFSWFDGFQNVQTISDSNLANIEIGGNINYNSVNHLIKITTDPKVYALEPGGVLRHVAAEAIAIQLFGENWASKVDDLPDAFFANYTLGQPIIDTYQYTSNRMALPLGTDIQIHSLNPKNQFKNADIRFEYPKGWEMISESVENNDYAFASEGPGSMGSFRCGDAITEDDLSLYNIQITNRVLSFAGYSLNTQYVFGAPNGSGERINNLNEIRINYIDDNGDKVPEKSCLLTISYDHDAVATQVFYSLDTANPDNATIDTGY